jgi:DNA methylase
MTVIDQLIGERFSIYHADTIDVARSLPDKSVDFAIYSPPFSSLYTYSANVRDIGNVTSDEEFFANYDYLAKEMSRVMRPGRVVAIHCMLIPTSKSKDGYIGLKDFRGDLIRAHQKHGMIFHSEVCIWKDPVTAMQRTKALGLLHKQVKKDSAMSRQGIADYVVAMRMPGINDKPVANVDLPVERWQRYASPIWVTVDEEDDEGFGICTGKAGDEETGTVNPTDTLQYRSARAHEDERHICPLQLPVIRRCMRLWSLKDDVVWSPFMGIGSEGVVAIEEGRRFIGAELKCSYYEQAKANVTAARVGGAKAQASLWGT